MASKPETQFRKKVRRDLQILKTRYKVFYEAIQQRSIRGSPDFILCICGDFFALELKKDENEQPTALQEKKLLDIARAGGIATPAHPGNWDDILQLLYEYAKNGEEDEANHKAASNASASDKIPYVEGHFTDGGSKALKN
jgi:hypothetical protein